MKLHIFRDFHTVWNRAINRAWNERARAARQAKKKIGRIPDEVTITHQAGVKAAFKD